MMSNKDDIQLLKDLSLICIDGKRFYCDSVDKVESPTLSAIFSDMARVREGFLIDINEIILSLGGEPTDKNGTISGAFHQKYTDIKAMLVPDNEYTYISQLEELEDRTLEKFREALANAKNPVVKNFIGIALIKFNKTHDEMKSLQLVTE
ncbi:ferritin-like domain-containing protein [Aliikangiella sp. IMCC44359]|uniref:ferritin-like domain-containing protein n=1 Tax=Aliikangiella sp. IMCC44359 TaxID=3459125 RepID=UPI00403AD5FE